MDVEQYVHTLIAANSAFVPEPPLLAEFFEGLVTAFHFRLNSDAPSQPRLRVVKPTGVLASGEWKRESRPLVLLTADGDPYEDTYLCQVSCHLRPKPVSPSCWNGADCSRRRGCADIR